MSKNEEAHGEELPHSTEFINCSMKEIKSKVITFLTR